MTTTLLTPDEIRDKLAHCYGSEGYRNWSMLFRNHYATEGAILLAETCGAYWLLDAIASHHADVRRRGGHRLMEFQCWKLKMLPASGDKPRRAMLRCYDGDSDKAVVTQRIAYTDFPLDEGAKLYVKPCDTNAEGTAYTKWCVMLPSEC